MNYHKHIKLQQILPGKDVLATSCFWSNFIQEQQITLDNNWIWPDCKQAKRLNLRSTISADILFRLVNLEDWDGLSVDFLR